jgi:hypothetical protein
MENGKLKIEKEKSGFTPAVAVRDASFLEEGRQVFLYFVFLPSVILLLLSFASCREKIPLKLTSRQADLADTLFLREAKDIRQRMDSICQAHFDERVQRVVDSMLVVRRKEEEALRARLRKLELENE